MEKSEGSPFGGQWGEEAIWRPTDEVIRNSRLKQFMDRHGIATWHELWQRSVDDIEWFWEAVLEDLNVEFYEPYTQILDLSNGVEWARWCVGGVLNIVHNCLDKWMGTATENKIALRWEGEEGDVRVLSYGDLYREVNRMANALRALGLGRGDAVGLYMPMVPEVAIALLAIVKIGGIVLPLFSGYGAGAIATRLADTEAKALFCSDGAYRRGRAIPMKPVADRALKRVPSVEHVILYRRTGGEVPWHEGRDHWWEDLVADQPPEAETERTEAEDPLMVIYTSGTTGRPKGAVHTHCGFPIKNAQDMTHGLDMHDTDVLYWMTDMGWMMGPWEVFGTLILGATMLFYDGAPDYPDVDRVWSLIERHRVTVLGVSPTFVRSIMAYGDEPVKRHDLSSLRIVGSTGEVWNPDPWLWFFSTVCQRRVPIINYTGGTELSGGILKSNVLLPIKPCAFNAPLPGMDADVLDENGQSVRGQVGELVIRQPWIGMTRGFWRDPQRYLATYWSRFPGVWVHGDWAVVDSDGSWYVLGRSDDTIKVAGKRLGPAEVESVVVSHPSVTEAAAIGVPDPVKGEAVVVFCVLPPNTVPTDELRAELRQLVVEQMGKPLAPKKVEFVSDLPKTRNAKVMRRVVRTAYLGQDPGDLSALVNPEVVEEIRSKKR